MESLNMRPTGKEPDLGAFPFWSVLDEELRTIREELLVHPIYPLIGNVASLRIFMASHVFAVWDFMSLLKTLQPLLRRVEVPRLPPPDPIAAGRVNRIELGEETDEVEA